MNMKEAESLQASNQMTTRAKFFSLERFKSKWTSWKLKESEDVWNHL